MHTSTFEQAALTDTTNEQEPQSESSEPTPTTQLEMQEAETTALVPTPTEQDVIEGEVIVIDPPETSEDQTPPKQKPYWLLIPFTVLLGFVFLAGSLLLPVLTPSATITLIPVEKGVSITTTIQIQDRQLAPLTLSQPISVLATGKKHQDATRAHGTITFYNGLLSSQTIAAGTLLTGSNGVQVVTDQAAILPAANPPLEGQVTISAHALLAGVQGNIQAYDINQACCAISVLAKNIQAFTDGAETRNYLVITKADIQNAVSSLKATLSQSEHAALQAQLHLGEGLITPSCASTVSSDHKPGDEVKQVRVTVSDTCSGIAYDAHTLHQNAMQLLITDVITKLGANYALLGDIQFTILHATIMDTRQGLANIIVQVTGTWVYQITPAIQQRLIRLVAGKSKQQAIATLLKFSGIAGAQIILRGGNQTLPADPRNVDIILVYREL